MNVNDEKEQTATVICFLIGGLVLATGIYDFFFYDLPIRDLINIVAVFLILVGLGLAPKTFFTPIGKLFSPSYKLPTLVNAKIQQSVIFSGVLLSVVCVIWGDWH